MSKKHARETNGDDVLRHPSPKRAKEIDEHPPMYTLQDRLKSVKSDHKTKNVLHWFRSKDLRAQDNRALYAASQKAKGAGSLLTIYLHSPEDLEWHGTSPARSDFILENLRILKDELATKHIPLTIVTAEQRADKSDAIMNFVKENDVSHMFANFEYEVDELRRDIKIARLAQQKGDLAFELFHDQTVVEPGTLSSGSGPHKVFTPYHKAWLVKTKNDPDLLKTVGEPNDNDKSATSTHSKLFDSTIPSLPESKTFDSKTDEDRIRTLWPAGNKAAMKRLDKFLKEKVSDYATNRSNPAGDPSSRLSAYFSAGVISVRQILAKATEFNKGAHFDEGDAGIASWVREIVFREFYRQTLVLKPHEAMNLPQNLKFDNVKWEDDEEGWKRWYEGKTGEPFIDAGMRQLNTEAYMHNRLRMNTASYLRANMFIDYRRGERYFAEHLIDWDLANNTNGWQPNYTVFNPVIQAEKCDPDGDYIRQWVPELKDVKGKAIFAPSERLSKEEFEKLGYPRPYVDFATSSQRAKERMKEGTHSAPPL